jgi:hypothetical protein
MVNKSLFVPVIGAACASLLVACGGGGSSTPATYTGVFNDSPVNGLAYSCAPSGQAGTTQGGGTFTYAAGDTCTFSLGAVTLGSAAAGELVTPVELVAGGTPSHATVINIVQLLTTADDDGDPSNGINIPDAVITAAANWTGVNVQSGTFDTDGAVAQMVADMYAAGAFSSTLTSSIVAAAHIEATASCVYSGLYNGSWSVPATTTTTSNAGEWGVLVYPDLTAKGFATDPDGGYGQFNGSFTPATKGVSISGVYTNADTSSGAVTATGTVLNPQSVSGTISGGGSFSGTRFAGSATATYRYTGFYQGTNGIDSANGVFSIDINANNVVSGKAYNFADGSTTVMSGSVGNNGTLTITSGVTAGAQLDLTNGTISSGTWTDGTYSGSFTGSGCKLN